MASVTKNLEPVGVGLLGAGIFAREAHLPAIALLAESSQSLTLKAIYSRSSKSTSALLSLAQESLKLDPASAGSLISTYSEDTPGSGLDELLARPDIGAVIVVLPLTHQPEIVLKALKAGKHVLSEKPVAKDVKSAVDLIETYEKEYKSNGLIWRVAENFECEPGIIAASRAIKSGQIGKVAFFKLSAVNFIDQTSKWYNSDWRTVPDYQGGFVLDGGVHSVALLRSILPSPIKSLSGFSSLTKSYLPPHDTIQAVLRLAPEPQSNAQIHGTLELSWAAPNRKRSESLVSVTGTEGFLELAMEVIEGTPYYILRIVQGSTGEETVTRYGWEGVKNEIEWFIKAVRGEEPPTLATEGVPAKGEPRGALTDVSVIEAALTSEGNPLDIL